MRTPRVLALGMTTLVLDRRLHDRRRRIDRPVRRRPEHGSNAPPRAPRQHGPVGRRPKADIRIGSDNFYESKLMGEIYAQVLEKAGYKVERKFGLGSRQERIPTMDAGQIDLVAEYVGSGLGFYDKTKITGDGQAERRRPPGGDQVRRA